MQKFPHLAPCSIPRLPSNLPTATKESFPKHAPDGALPLCEVLLGFHYPQEEAPAPQQGSPAHHSSLVLTLASHPAACCTLSPLASGSLGSSLPALAFLPPMPPSSLLTVLLPPGTSPPHPLILTLAGLAVRVPCCSLSSPSPHSALFTGLSSPVDREPLKGAKCSAVPDTEDTFISAT